jgi:hypothetical protein
MAPGLTIADAESVTQITQARELFLEYAQSLGFSLCFQSFDQELAGLPGDYAAPAGRLLLAEYDGQLAGCVALHRLGPEICEMKMRLDTVEPIMKDAVAMYRRLGFREIEPYRLNPIAGAMYMELEL